MIRCVMIEVVSNHGNRSIKKIMVLDDDGIAGLAAADVNKWAGEGVLTLIYRIIGCP